jgi:RimJ/RimL family protein N-acetyltransferase
MPGPAYRIETPRLVVRCYAPADAPLLKAAIDDSLDHLRPWMPWALTEPRPIEDKVALLRKFRGEFDHDQNYNYGVFAADERRVLGAIGLHPRIGPRALEIGYWIHAAHIGQGLCTEMAGAATRIGFEVLGLARMEIHCDPANHRSAAVPRKLGYQHEATLRARLVQPDGSLRDTMFWTLFAADYPASAAARADVRAFDAVGARLL